jgi:hypothetical protein
MSTWSSWVVLPSNVFVKTAPVGIACETAPLAFAALGRVVRTAEPAMAKATIKTKTARGRFMGQAYRHETLRFHVNNASSKPLSNNQSAARTIKLVTTI